MKHKLAPIVLFVYNRPWHTKQTIEALQKNKLASKSELFIYSDAPKNKEAEEKVKEVREYIKNIDGFKKVTIIERDKNFGLANNIIDGVTKIINQYGKIIVLEDDLVTSPYFLKFMNEALEFYQDEKMVLSITGFSFSQNFMKFPINYNKDIYFHIRPMSWSWGTWKDRWKLVDWGVSDYGEFVKNRSLIKKFKRGGTDLPIMLEKQINKDIDSWYIRFTYCAFKNNLYTVYPKISYVNNIGHDGSGVHCGVDKMNVFSHRELNMNSEFILDKSIEINEKIIKNFNKAFNVKNKAQIKNILLKILKKTKKIKSFYEF